MERRICQKVENYTRDLKKEIKCQVVKAIDTINSGEELDENFKKNFNS